MGFSTHSLNTIGVIDCELGVVRSLDSFIDDTIDDTQGVEVQLNTLLSAIGNLLVLSVEVVEELFWLISNGVRKMADIGLQLAHSV